MPPVSCESHHVFSCNVKALTDPPVISGLALVVLKVSRGGHC